MFNKRVFLESKLNNGSEYGNDDCGCIKNNYLKACALELGQETFNKKTKNLLDIAEGMLLAGYPQKAKLFVVENIDKCTGGRAELQLLGNPSPFFRLAGLGSHPAKTSPYTAGITIPIVDKVKTRIKETVNV